MLKQLEERAKELAKELEESAAKHNALVGAMTEVKKLYEDAVKAASDASTEVLEGVVE